MKIFHRLLLGFLAANALTVLVVMALSSAWWLMSYPAAKARSDAQQAVELYEAGDLRALRQWLHTLKRETGIYGMLLDEENGRLLHSRRGPPRSPRVRVLMQDGAEHPAIRAFGQRVRSIPVSGRDSDYRWVAIVPPPGEGRSRLLMAAIYMLIGALLIAAAALWLARSISQPLRRLTDVSHEMSGDGPPPELPAPLLKRSDEIGELARTFRHMTRRLSDLLQTQRQLLRDVSHELRSPLARMQIATELARDNPQQDYFDRIAQETERLDALIGQILLLQRLDSTPQNPQREDLSVAELMEDLCQDIAFEAQAAGVTLATPDWQTVRRSGDPELLRAAFENVLRNAVRFSPRGGTVRIAQCVEGSTETVTIGDEGPGVPEELLETIFEPFVRASKARETDGGHGVGLAIALRAILRHGGAIRARNLPEKGLEVEIALPVKAGSGTA